MTFRDASFFSYLFFSESLLSSPVGLEIPLLESDINI